MSNVKILPHNGEGIQTHEDGMTSITGDGLRVYRLLQLRSALKLEVSCPGLKASRGSVMNAVKEEFGIKGSTKKKVLEQFEDMLREAGILKS